MRMIVTNERHPMELKIVETMLRKEAVVKSIVMASSTRLIAEVPTFGWYTALRQAIGFVTTCHCQFEALNELHSKRD